MASKEAGHSGTSGLEKNTDNKEQRQECRLRPHAALDSCRSARSFLALRL